MKGPVGILISPGIEPITSCLGGKHDNLVASRRRLRNDFVTDFNIRFRNHVNILLFDISQCL